jgi:hypothetical protein
VAVRKRSVAAGLVTVPSPVVRDWRSLVFAPLGDGQRRRRGSDGVRLAVAVLATACAVLAVQTNSRPEKVIADVLSPPPDGVRWLVDVFWVGGSFGTVAVLLLLAAVRRRWDVMRDLAIAAGGALAVSGILVLTLGAAGRRPHTVFAGYHLSFPVLHVAVAVGVATVGLPYLARGVQRLIESVLALAILATVVAGQGLPANVVGSMAIGWGVTDALHLALGSPAGTDPHVKQKFCDRPRRARASPRERDFILPRTTSDKHSASARNASTATPDATIAPYPSGSAAPADSSPEPRPPRQIRMLCKPRRHQLREKARQFRSPAKHAQT